jgi:hypothetical protein
VTLSDRRDNAQRIKHLIIVVVVVLAVTLPIWGIFVGGMLRDGSISTALFMLGLVFALVLLPIAIVAVFSLMLQRGAHWLDRSLHQGLIVGLGALLGTGLMVAFVSNPFAGLLLGAIPGAIVAMCMLPERPPSGSRRDAHHG